MGILESINLSRPAVPDSLDNVTNTNVFLNAMSPTAQTDLALFEQDKWGSILRNHKIVSGSGASIIDATLDYFLHDLQDDSARIEGLDKTLQALKHSSATQRFIPIVLKTEHTYSNLAGSYNKILGTEEANRKFPLYIIFDSTPDSFNFQKSANWEPKSIQGRPEPVQTYSNSSATTITLQGDFFVSSKVEHLYKLKLSEYLMSLVTPSKYNYMPSPITVTIGEWKQFRAIVNNVSIDYKGPWTVKDTKLTNDLINQNITQPRQTSNLDIPSHAPYIFSASLSLTLVSPGNKVVFAEDIVNPDSVYNKSNAGLSDEEMQDIQGLLQAGNALTSSQASYQTIDNKPTSGAFVSWQNPGSSYTFQNGMIIQQTRFADVTVNREFNTFDQANLDRQRADLAMITHVINGQLTNFISKKFENDSLLGKLF